MSFICEKCHEVVPPKTPMRKVIVETRPKTYVQVFRDKNAFEHETRHYGREIVKELKLCPKCAQEYENE